MDWAEWKARRQKAPAIRRVPLCADGEALAELEEARTSRDPKLRRRIPELEERVAQATINVVLRALPADEYAELKDQYRPTDPKEVEEGRQWTDDFMPALVAACLVEPADIDPKELWELASAGERRQLFLAAHSLNVLVPDLDFTKPGIGLTPGTGRPSTT